MIAKLKSLWAGLRRLSGDDAYEHYLQQHTEHGHDELPLSRHEFFKKWQDSKWQGVKRCC